MKLVGFCALALVIGMSAAMADPMKIRTGWVSATSDTPLLLGKSAGITKHEGISYTLEAVHFQGSPQQLMAFAASELDFVGFGYSALPTAILNAGMGDLRIIGDVFQDGAPGSYSNEFLVLKDGPIHSVADLKGKVAATNGAGSAIDMALRVMLKKGSRTGNLCDPASTTCSRMCATPVESFGTVGKKTAKELLSSAHSTWMCRAPVRSCSSSRYVPSS